MRGYFRKTEESDILPISENLRASDLEEIRIAAGLPPHDCLMYGYKESDECNTIVLDGVPSAMFGITRVEWGGVPWLLSTSDFRCVRYSFLKRSKKWLDEAAPKYNLLKNVVHDENVVAIRWLKFLGFEITNEIPIEKDDKVYNFWEFERRSV